jgi:hypothetical protein
VYELVSELKYHARWIAGVTYLSSDARLEPGLRYESVTVAMGSEMAGRHIVRQVVEPQMVEIYNVTGPLESTIQYTLAGDEAGTKVTCSFWIWSNHPVFGLAMPLVEMLARTRIEGDLKNLKVFAEAG